MSSYDPSIDQANAPASGYLPQITTQTYNPVSTGTGSGASPSQLGRTSFGQNGMTTVGGPYTVGTAAPTTGSYAPPAPAAQPSYAPVQSDLGFDATSAGMGENVSAALIGHYADTGIPSTAQNAQGAYDEFNRSTPADMSSYYNNASRNSANRINTEMAARGSYGSSNAVGVLGNAETNLRAQQAKDEAGYGLQRAGLRGTLAGGADQSSLAHSADERNWVGALSDLGFKNQREGAARFQMGYGIANDLADKASGIEASTGSAEIQAQEQLLMQQLMSQGMSASDASTAAHNTVAAQNASDARAVDTTEKAIQAGAMFV